ncbi:hypothetical protein D3C86_1374340 [compost metagenome]
MKAEQADGGRDGQLEEIAGADEGRRPGDAMALTRHPVQEVGKPRIQIDLDEDRDGKQTDDGWLGDDLLALEGEEKNQRRKQRHQRNRLQPCKNAIQCS